MESPTELLTAQDLNQGEGNISILKIQDIDISHYLALIYLDKEVEQSKNLRKISPIKFVAVGGYVSVTYLQNRPTTEDIDYILDPQIEDQVKTEEKLQVAIQKVAKSKGYSSEWFNNKVAQFAVNPTRIPLF